MIRRALVLILLASPAWAGFAINPFGGGGASLPAQTGQNGKFLTTDGTSASWGTPAGAGDVLQADLYTDGKVKDTLIPDGITRDAEAAAAYAPLAAIDDTAYDAGTWDAVTDKAPTQNAVRDEIESVKATIGALDAAAVGADAAGTAAGLISDTAYGVGWNGDTGHSPSKNAVYDALQLLGGDVTGPASSNDSTIVLFDGLTGKAIKDSTYTITAAGAALLDDAAASNQRTTLGLEIGTNVQAWDAQLDDLADGSLTGSAVSSATSIAVGVVELATDAEAVTGADSTRAVTPANLAARMAAPGTIGGTTPGAATFTSVTVPQSASAQVAEFYEASGDGTNKITITAQAMGSDVSINWPASGSGALALVTGGTYSGTHDFGGATVEIPNNTARPGTCTVGQLMLDTDATLGQQLYGCTSADTWTLMGDGTGAEGAIIDTAFGSGWNADTTHSPSANTLYDWGHVFDTDDDGKVNVLDVGAGITKTDSNGVVSAAARSDYDAAGVLGSHGTPVTDNPYTLTAANSYGFMLFYGATGEIDLPAGASGMNGCVYNTGAFTVTFDPNGSEVIVRDGTAQTGGVTMTLSSGAGNYVCMVHDGTKWVTLGFKGTLAQGS
jgi:hypothetical protein